MIRCRLQSIEWHSADINRWKSVVGKNCSTITATSGELFALVWVELASAALEQHQHGWFSELPNFHKEFAQFQARLGEFKCHRWLAIICTCNQRSISCLKQNWEPGIKSTYIIMRLTNTNFSICIHFALDWRINSYWRIHFHYFEFKIFDVWTKCFSNGIESFASSVKIGRLVRCKFATDSLDFACNFLICCAFLIHQINGRVHDD